jgi:hypothetical protein
MVVAEKYGGRLSVRLEQTNIPSFGFRKITGRGIETNMHHEPLMVAGPIRLLNPPRRAVLARMLFELLSKHWFGGLGSTPENSTVRIAGTLQLLFEAGASM